MPTEVKWAISFAAGAGLLAIGWKFFAVLLVLHVFICLVLIGVILLQSGEAADLAGAFGGSGSQTAFGPRGATTFLSRATTWCAIMFMFTSLEMTLHVSTSTTGPGGGGSVLEQFSTPAPAAPAPAQPGTPAAPAITPGQPAPATSAPTQGAPAQPTAPTQTAPPATPAAPAQSAPPASQ